jgi:hypothetical protein
VSTSITSLFCRFSEDQKILHFTSGRQRRNHPPRLLAAASPGFVRRFRITVFGNDFGIFSPRRGEMSSFGWNESPAG